MKLFFLACLLALCASEPLRVIMFNQTNIQKLTMEQVDALALDPTIPGFMDITDFPVDNTGKGLQNCNYMPAPTSIKRETVVRPLFSQISASNVEEYDVHLASYFNRYYTTADGENSAVWIMEKAKSFATAAGRSDVTVERFEHSWRQPSIIARIPGTSSQHAPYRVVYGAHEDSTAGGASRRAPGACDNGSGSSVLLETLRILMENNYRPERTVELQWFAAEEVGLYGSAAIANSYASNGVCVEAMFNYDMVAYPNPSVTRQMRVITDSAFTDASFNNFLRVMITGYTDLPFVNYNYGYAASDHASYARAGYRACHSKENGNYSPIHTDRDVPSNLDFGYSTEFVKLGLAWCYEMGFVN